MTNPNVLFANAMEAINIQYDRQRTLLKQDYERKLAEIAANEQAAIAEAKQNVKAARKGQNYPDYAVVGEREHLDPHWQHPLWEGNEI